MGRRRWCRPCRPGRARPGPGRRRVRPHRTELNDPPPTYILRMGKTMDQQEIAEQLRRAAEEQERAA
ncbi:hypothetical protein E6P78_32150 [Streptomyces sp. A0958]|nr:hypothetical protein E6P78_32150 [Streptomyces sp. A0958]